MRLFKGKVIVNGKSRSRSTCSNVYLSAISTLQYCFSLPRSSITCMKAIDASTSVVHTSAAQELPYGNCGGWIQLSSIFPLEDSINSLLLMVKYLKSLFSSLCWAKLTRE